MQQNNPPPDDPAQSQRFLDMAREVEAGELEERTEPTFDIVSTLPPREASKKKANP